MNVVLDLKWLASGINGWISAKHRVIGNKPGGKAIRSVNSVEFEEDEDQKEEFDGQVNVIGDVKDDFEVDAYFYGMPISSLVNSGADC